MVYNCIVNGCTNLRGKGERRAFHAFPKKNDVLREAWKHAVGREDGLPNKARVCSDHFTESSYKSKNKSRWILNDDAVPSEMLDLPHHPPPKRRKTEEPLEELSRVTVETNQESDEIMQPSTSSGNVERPLGLRDICSFFRDTCDLGKKKAVQPPVSVTQEEIPQEPSQPDEKVRRQLQLKEKECNRWRMRFKRLKSKLKKMKCKVCEQNSTPKTIVKIPEGRFDDKQLAVVRELMSEKKQGKQYSEGIRKFAHGLLYYSPRAYDHVAQLFTLPSTRTMRSDLSGIDCWPGLLSVCFNELARHKGDIRYSDGALSVDEMSIKKLVQYVPSLGRGFGFVDYGGLLEKGDSKDLATDALVVMVTGLRSHWKLPLAWFLVHGVCAKDQAQIINMVIYRCYEDAELIIRTTVMDGTAHNVATFNSLGCNLTPEDGCVEKIETSFPHPHPKVDGPVYAMLDPGHMAKNIRGLLKHYGQIEWVGRGWVKWKYLELLDNIQTLHDFRLGNKLTSKHINFEKNKMKVKLAVQLMSDSVARALKWAYHEKIEGFYEDDCLVTAQFLELHDRLFDILNSRAPNLPGYKGALSVGNFPKISAVFENVKLMYFDMCITQTRKLKRGVKVTRKKLLLCDRKTGPLGMLACIQTVEKLVNDMRCTCSTTCSPTTCKKVFKMLYLCMYKCQQDMLETYFSAIRQKSRFNMNPDALQVLYSFRSLIMHAGEYIKVKTGNCMNADEVVLLTVSKSVKTSIKKSSSSVTVPPQEIDWETEKIILKNQVLCSKSCIADTCKICSAAIPYIAGFYVKVFEKLTDCQECKFAMAHSDADPCPNNSLILFKNYTTKPGSGLKTPSGSLCKLLFLCEKTLRRNYNSLHITHIANYMIMEILKEVNDRDIFSQLARSHSLETQFMGADNHFMSLVRLLSRKYFELRIKKILKDEARARSDGNSIHRIRIFTNQ